MHFSFPFSIALTTSSAIENDQDIFSITSHFFTFELHFHKKLVIFFPLSRDQVLCLIFRTHSLGSFEFKNSVHGGFQVGVIG